MTADLSRAHRRDVERLVRASGILASDLGARDKLIYVVGALICDEIGRVKKTALLDALDDPSIVQAAQTILARAARPSA